LDNCIPDFGRASPVLVEIADWFIGWFMGDDAMGDADGGIADRGIADRGIADDAVCAPEAGVAVLATSRFAEGSIA
jgi:hypothetical protein